MGTIGFIELCSYKYNIFSRQLAINILEEIKSSKFRIKNEIIDLTIKRLQGIDNG